MTRQDILASFLAKICQEVGEGHMGGVSRGVVFLRSEDGEQAIVLNYPPVTPGETADELALAIAWLQANPDAEFPPQPMNGVLQ